MALGVLPEYPWDLMVPYRDRAASHRDGIVDLSIGSPVDPTPQVVRDALTAATDAHAYPDSANRRAGGRERTAVLDQLVNSRCLRDQHVGCFTGGKPLRDVRGRVELHLCRLFRLLKCLVERLNRSLGGCRRQNG